MPVRCSPTGERPSTAGTHVRAQSHGVFRADRSLARKARRIRAARIISTASGAHMGASSTSTICSSRNHSRAGRPIRARNSATSCSRELARRLEGTGVTANCLHPGFVASRFGDEAGGLVGRFAGLAKLFAISPGARRIRSSGSPLRRRSRQDRRLLVQGGGSPRRRARPGTKTLRACCGRAARRLQGWSKPSR